MRTILLIALALLPSWGWSAVLATKSGTMTSAQTATGRSTNSINAQKNNNNVYGSVTICYKLNSGTSATIQTEYRQADQSDWATVKSSSIDLATAGTTYDCIGITDPQGIYSTNVTACSGCNVTTTFEFGPAKQQL